MPGLKLSVTLEEIPEVSMLLTAPGEENKLLKLVPIPLPPLLPVVTGSRGHPGVIWSCL